MAGMSENDEFRMLVAKKREDGTADPLDIGKYPQIQVQKVHRKTDGTIAEIEVICYIEPK
jgi:hypothetical protein